jgi:hypothetical protein
MSSRDSDTKNLLEKAEQEGDVAMTTEKVKVAAQDQSSAGLDPCDVELEKCKDDVEIEDAKLAMTDDVDVTMETKEESTNEKTGLISSDSSSSSSDSEDESKGQGPVQSESDIDFRIDNLTKR